MGTGEGRSAHCRTDPQQADPFRNRRRLAGVAQHLLYRHLVARRRDLGDLEKTPTTTSLAPSVCALPPANSRNNTATHTGRQTGCRDAQQPDRTVCCARRGRRAGGGHHESEAEADEKDGGASHRIGRPPRLRPPHALATPEQGSYRCLRYPPGCAAMARAPSAARSTPSPSASRRLGGSGSFRAPIDSVLNFA